MTKFIDWLIVREATKATIYTQHATKGASVDDSKRIEPTVMLNMDDIVNYEPFSKMSQPESQTILDSIVKTIESGQTLPPIVVRKADNLRGTSKRRWTGQASLGGMPNSRYQYQVLDGHHRYWAYKKAGVRLVPATIVSSENIRREKFWSDQD